ncbi:unnamed protein product [Trichobilharzia szidati]|nr:unnamed protein product [Trichobilharzia szidati]
MQRIVPVTFYAGYWTSPFILLTAITFTLAKSKVDGKFYKLAIFSSIFTLIVCILGILFSLISIYWILDITNGYAYYEYREEMIVQCSLITLAGILALINLFIITCCSCCGCFPDTSTTISTLNNSSGENAPHLKSSEVNNQRPLQIQNNNNNNNVNQYPELNNPPAGNPRINQKQDLNYIQPLGYPPPYT